MESGRYRNRRDSFDQRESVCAVKASLRVIYGETCSRRDNRLSNAFEMAINFFLANWNL